MKKLSFLVAIIFMVTLVFNVNPNIYAENEKVTIQMESAMYKQGETVTINGISMPDRNITLKVTCGTDIKYIDVFSGANNKGAFSFKFTLPTNAELGNYSVVAGYDNIVASAAFTVSKSTVTPTPMPTNAPIPTTNPNPMPTSTPTPSPDTKTVVLLKDLDGKDDVKTAQVISDVLKNNNKIDADTLDAICNALERTTLMSAAKVSELLTSSLSKIDTIKADAILLIGNALVNKNGLSSEMVSTELVQAMDKVGTYDKRLPTVLSEVINNCGKVDTTKLKQEKGDDGKILLSVLAADFQKAIETVQEITNPVAAKLSDEAKERNVAEKLKLNVMVTVEVPADLSTNLEGVSVPAENLGNAQKSDIGLKFVTQTSTMEFPPDAIPSNQLNSTASIKFLNFVLDEKNSQGITTKVLEKNASYKLVGKIYNFEAVAVDSNNKESKISFQDKVKVILNFGNDILSKLSNTKKAVVARLNDDGTITVRGGRAILDGTFEFYTSSFSSYAVMQYNTSFKDVSSTSWAKDYIEILAARQITSGISKDNFAPSQSVTRAQFAAFMVRALGINTEDYRGVFKDVNSSAWYAKEVEAANAAGIVSGIGDGKFNPDAKITREQMAAMIMRSYEKVMNEKTADISKEYESGKLKDIDKVSLWAADYVKAANVLGIVEGNNKLYQGAENSTREQVAKVITILLEKMDQI
jgi:hypothetical protein